MPIDPNDMNDIRVDVLGTSVDKATTWTTTGLAANRNALADTITERVITRLLNDFVTDISGAVGSTNVFADRFTNVIGDEGGPDQTAFAAIGSNLIQAVATGISPILFAATPPTPQPGRLYSNTTTGRVYMAGPTGGWFRVF